jgi:transglutaminase-like putative cysteine protease
MRFGLIHRIMTDSLAALGLLALVTSGELNRWVSIGIVLGLALALGVPERWQDRQLIVHAGRGAPVALLVLQTTRYLFDGSLLLPLAVEFAAALQVVRLATRRGAAHDQQVIVLALLHLIAGTVLGGGLPYGLCFIGFLIVAPGALVLSHLRREVEGNYRQGARDRTGLPVDVPRILKSRRVIGQKFLLITCLLSIPIFLFTAALFVLFPRIALSVVLLNHSRPGRMIGFSDHVDLGGVGKLRENVAIAMRVEYPNLPPDPPARIALYLRGTAFDQYDGKSWLRSLSQQAGRRGLEVAQKDGAVPLFRYPDPVRDRVMRIMLEPIDPPVLFVPPDAVALKLVPRSAALYATPPTVLSGPEDEYKYASADDRGVRYEVYLAQAGEAHVQLLPVGQRKRYLALPPGLPNRIRELARQWAGARTDPYDQARAIEAHLRTDYRYDLDSPSGAAADPLDDFLFRSKRGHCEFYSTAMAVLLRTLGVPTRNVTGFIGGTFNRFGRFYAVRQGDAHSWVEVYVDARGWTRFDPTPPANSQPQSEITGVLAFIRDFYEAATQRWNRHVINYDLKQQFDLLSSMRSHYRDLKRSAPWSSEAPALSGLLWIGVLIAGTALLIAIRRWLKRRKPRRGTPREGPEDAAQIVELYKALDSALATRGVPRFTSTPPLSHAMALADLRHPLASEVLALTEVYLGVRFGGRALSDNERRDFARRVRSIRTARDMAQNAA